MRLVAFADTHQFHDDLTVPDGDVLICAGDVCRGGERHELELFLAWFEAQPHRHKVLVPGNHDGCLVFDEVVADVVLAHPPEDRGLQLLIDRAVVIDGLRFYGTPWTPRFGQWAFMGHRDELHAYWAHIPDDTDVLISHGPPKGILDDVAAYHFGAMTEHDDLRNDRRFVGCAALRARVEVVQPPLMLFGHIHSQPGVKVLGATTAINCTTNEGDGPCAIIDVDVDVDTDTDTDTPRKRVRCTIIQAPAAVLR